jgi:hypothetical protein
VPANRVPRKRRLSVEADRSSAERTRLLLARSVVALLCSNTSRHSGLWRGVGTADLWVHGLGLKRQRLAPTARFSLVINSIIISSHCCHRKCLRVGHKPVNKELKCFVD